MLMNFMELERAIADEAWRTLHLNQEGPANPFCAPSWVAAWYRRYVPDPQRRRLAFVRSDRGELLGVAPLWIDQDRLGPVPLVSRLRLVGAGQGSSLLEVPQILTAKGEGRAVLGAVMAELADPGSPLRDAHLFDLVVADGQGWLEPEWFADPRSNASSWDHIDTKASVIVPLAATWPDTLSGLKRNVKESLRRSRNRLAKQDLPYQVVERSTDLDAEAVRRFFDLHGLRADHDDSSSHHHNAFADPARRDFLAELLPVLGADGDAAIWELWLDGRQVAAQLLLYAPDTVYVHSSGFDPSTWQFGPVTYLQEQAFKAACAAGLRWVNLSPGPNVAKLRWSEQVLRHDEFSVGFGSRATIVRQTVLGMARSLRAVTHNARIVEKPR